MVNTYWKNSKGLKILVTLILVFLAVILIGGLVLFIEFKDEIRSIHSIEEIIGPDQGKGFSVYKIQVQGNYYMDDFMNQGGVGSTHDLMNFLVSQMTRGFYNMETEEGQAGACSSFTAETKDGQRIFARNYDMDTKPSIGIIHTKPEDGRYESLTIANLSYVGIGEGGISSIEDEMGFLAATYVPMDGINEKGLAVSIHMSYQGPGEEVFSTDLNTGKLGLTSTSMVRLILDKAANIQEAVEIAKNIDLHEDLEQSFHYFLADQTGQSAVLQWTKGTDSIDTNGSQRELSVIYSEDDNPYIPSENFRILTNFITVPDYYQEGDILAGLDRYEILSDLLGKTDGFVEDEKEAMNFLGKVGASRNGLVDYYNTSYSVVYNLTDKSLTLVPYENYQDPNMWIEYKLGK